MIREHLCRNRVKFVWTRKKGIVLVRFTWGRLCNSQWQENNHVDSNKLAAAEERQKPLRIEEKGTRVKEIGNEKQKWRNWCSGYSEGFFSLAFGAFCCRRRWARPANWRDTSSCSYLSMPCSSLGYVVLGRTLVTVIEKLMILSRNILSNPILDAGMVFSSSSSLS